ncbi:MAG TPA: hypothetical protein VF701_11275 [Thermoanaerobaculia bacterium]
MLNHRIAVRTFVALLFACCLLLLHPFPASAEDAGVEVAGGEADGNGLQIKRYIEFRSVALPQAFCDSEIECGRVGAAVLSSCGVTRPDGYYLEPVLMVTGKIYYFAGPLSALRMRPRTDRSVKDVESIRTHVAEWHVNPGIDAVRPLIEPFTEARFATQEECVAESQRLSLEVHSAFSEAIRETQSLENRAIDVPRYLRSKPGAAAGPA